MERHDPAVSDAAHESDGRMHIAGEWVKGEGPELTVLDKFRLQPLLRIQSPNESFALPTVTLDIVDGGMYIDFRHDTDVVCCRCHKDALTVSCRSAGLQEKGRDPREAASLLGKLIREHLFRHCVT